MARQLIYFDIKGLGEGIRYILHYGGLEFEDFRIPRADWPQCKGKYSSPVGKLPVYKEGNVTLHQSSVIAKYIGKQVGLVPTDALEEAQTDIVIQTFFDLFNNLRPMFTETDPVKKEQIGKKFLEESIPLYFSVFDKQISENNGYFVNKLSWADLVAVSMMELMNDVLSTEVYKNYKNLKQLAEKVYNLKGIKTYIQNRKN